MEDGVRSMEVRGAQNIHSLDGTSHTTPTCDSWKKDRVNACPGVSPLHWGHERRAQGFRGDSFLQEVQWLQRFDGTLGPQVRWLIGTPMSCRKKTILGASAIYSETTAYSCLVAKTAEPVADAATAARSDEV